MSTTVVETDPTGRYVRYEKVLGKGAFKTVYLGFDTVDAIEVAWNKLQISKLTPQELASVAKEVSFLQHVTHKNIINLFASWESADKSNGSGSIDFITELMMSGTLKDFITRAPAIKLKVIRRWSLNIIEAIAYLHSNEPPIMHRDLKCDNIFINGHVGEVKLGDLGLSSFKEREKAGSVIGTPEFMAPEVYNECYTELVDVYAFGMCVLEMVTMEYPYNECKNPAQVFKKVTAGVLPEALSRIKDSQFKEVITICLAREENRPTAEDLVNHPLFRDWALDDGRLSNLSLLPEENYKSMPDGGHKVYHAEAMGRDVLVVQKENELRIAPPSLEAHIPGVAESPAMGLRMAIDIPVKGTVKRIEFPFDPEVDMPETLAQEMVEEFGLDATHEAIIIQQIMDQVKNGGAPLIHPSISDSMELGGFGLDGQGSQHESNSNMSSQVPSPHIAAMSIHRQPSLPLPAMKLPQGSPKPSSSRHQGFYPGVPHPAAMGLNSLTPTVSAPQAGKNDSTGPNRPHRASFAGTIPGGAQPPEIVSISGSAVQSPVPHRNAQSAVSHIPIVVVGGDDDDPRGAVAHASSHPERGAVAQMSSQPVMRDSDSTKGSLRGSLQKFDAKFFTSCMALMDACSEGDIELVKKLIKEGASAAYMDYDKRAPIHLAAGAGHTEIVKLLVQNGADIKVTDRWGSTPMMEAVRLRRLEVVRLLKHYGAKSDGQSMSDPEIALSKQLMELSARGLLTLAKEKLMGGASAMYADYDKRTPLHLAASEGHPKVAELLLINGAQLDAKDLYERTPVDDAVRNGHRDVLLVMKQFGANIPGQIVEDKGSTDAFLAGCNLIRQASLGKNDRVKAILDQGVVNVNFQDYDQRTALHLAAVENRLETVDLLLARGADLTLADRWGSSPLDEAQMLDDKEIERHMRSFINASGVPSNRDDEG